ncbi:MAG: class I adenylate-forming enzyme family protein [Acidimicrobiales bacterium]
MHVGETIDRAVVEVPERTALVVDGLRTTYAELDLLARHCAAALVGAGVGAGDTVAVVDQGGPLSVASILGAARLGAAGAQMNPDLKIGEMAALCRLVGCTVGIAGAGYADKLGEALGTPALTKEGILGVDADRTSRHTPIEGDSTGLVLFSSGSTGLPKPVYISHRTLVDRLTNYAGALTPEEEPRVDMISVPLFHIGGTLGLLITLYSGRSTVILPRFDAGAWLRAVEEYRVNQTFVVPTMLRRVLDHPDFAVRDLSSLRSLSYGAAPAPPELIKRALAALPSVDFSNTFGQTETLGAYAALSPDDHRAGRKLDSVGRPFPGVELRVVDVLTHEDVGVGEVGEAVVRSAQNITSEWMPTGDLVQLDEDGYLYVKGRLKDTINRGGEKFGPIEIESAIRALPGVVEVAVAGVPDDELGERVGALIVGNGEVGADEVRAYCRGVLARYKVPEVIVFVDELPYNRFGKLPRAAVVEAIRARAG